MYWTCRSFSFAHHEFQQHKKQYYKERDGKTTTMTNNNPYRECILIIFDITRLNKHYKFLATTKKRWKSIITNKIEEENALKKCYFTIL